MSNIQLNFVESILPGRTGRVSAKKNTGNRLDSVVEQDRRTTEHREYSEKDCVKLRKTAEKDRQSTGSDRHRADHDATRSDSEATGRTRDDESAPVENSRDDTDKKSDDTAESETAATFQEIVKKLSEAEQAARAEVTAEDPVAEADRKTAGTGATNTDPWAGYRPGRQFGVNPAETALTDVARAAAESATTAANAANNTAPGQTATATAGTPAPAGTPQAATTAAAGSEAAQTNQAGSQNVAAETADAAATEQASTQKAVQAAATEPAAPETQNPQAVAAAPETATEAGSEQTRQPARPADATQPATENPAAQRARSEYANNSGPAAKVNPADDPAASDAVSRETNSATTAPARPAAQNRNTNDRPGTSSQQVRSVAQAVGNAGPTAETSPTQAPTAPVDRLADAQPGRQIMEALQARTFQNNDQITIRLDPPEMGSVRIRIQTDESGGLRARLEVENNRTMTELQRETPSLMQRLSENGIEMRRLEFSFTGQDSSDGQAGFSMFQNASDGQGQSAGRGLAGTGEDPEQAVIEEDTPIPAVREQADGSINVVM